jgi:hypothetical protein
MKRLFRPILMLTTAVTLGLAGGGVISASADVLYAEVLPTEGSSCEAGPAPCGAWCYAYDTQPDAVCICGCRSTGGTGWECKCCCESAFYGLVCVGPYACS